MKLASARSSTVDANEERDDSGKNEPPSRLARFRRWLPMLAVVSIVAAIGYHTLRGGSPAGGGDAPAREGETQAAANTRRDAVHDRITQRARDVESGNTTSSTAPANPSPAAGAPTPPAPTAAPVAVAGNAPPVPTPAAPPSPTPPANVAAVPTPTQPPATTASPAAPVPQDKATKVAIAPPVPVAPAVPAVPPQPSAMRPAPSPTRPVESARSNRSDRSDRALAAEQPAAPAASREPDRATLEYRQARSALNDGYAANAVLHLWAVLDYAPDHRDAQTLLTQLLEARGERDSAIQMLQGSLRQRPHQPHARALLAALQARTTLALQ